MYCKIPSTMTFEPRRSERVQKRKAPRPDVISWMPFELDGTFMFPPFPAFEDEEESFHGCLEKPDSPVKEKAPMVQLPIALLSEEPSVIRDFFPKVEAVEMIEEVTGKEMEQAGLAAMFSMEIDARTSLEKVTGLPDSQFLQINYQTQQFEVQPTQSVHSQEPINQSFQYDGQPQQSDSLYQISNSQLSGGKSQGLVDEASDQCDGSVNHRNVAKELRDGAQEHKVGAQYTRDGSDDKPAVIRDFSPKIKAKEIIEEVTGREIEQIGEAAMFSMEFAARTSLDKGTGSPDSQFQQINYKIEQFEIQPSQYVHSQEPLSQSFQYDGQPQQFDNLCKIPNWPFSDDNSHELVYEVMDQCDGFVDHINVAKEFMGGAQDTRDGSGNFKSCLRFLSHNFQETSDNQKILLSPITDGAYCISSELTARKVIKSEYLQDLAQKPLESLEKENMPDKTCSFSCRSRSHFSKRSHSFSRNSSPLLRGKNAISRAKSPPSRKKVQNSQKREMMVSDCDESKVYSTYDDFHKGTIKKITKNILSKERKCEKKRTPVIRKPSGQLIKLNALDQSFVRNNDHPKILNSQLGKSNMRMGPSGELKPAGTLNGLVKKCAKVIFVNDNGQMGKICDYIQKEDIPETGTDELEVGNLQKALLCTTIEDGSDHCESKLEENKIVRNRKGHGSCKKAKKQKERQSGVYSCTLCSYKTIHKGHFNCHVNAIHGEIRYPCYQCEYKAKHKGNLKIHILSVHTGAPYTCTLCDFKTTWKVGLKRHIAKYHDGVRYPCDMCKRKAAKRGRLHHHDIRVRYACNQCEFKIMHTRHLNIDEEKLKVRLKTDTGDKPYVCDWEGCEKKFTWAAYKIHVTSHTGEKKLHM